MLGFVDNRKHLITKTRPAKAIVGGRYEKRIVGRLPKIWGSMDKLHVNFIEKCRENVLM